MREEIVKRQRGVMNAKGWDALVAISPENFAYTTGFVVPSQAILRWRHAMTVIKSDGESGIVAVDMEESTVRNKAPGEEIRIWGEFTDCAMETLADLLSDMGLAEGSIGLERDYLPVGDYSRLQKRLPKAKFTGAEAEFARMRQIKTEAEIDLLRRLSRISDKAITEAFCAVSEGHTEMDLAAALTRGVFTLGAEHFKLMIVATGERSVFPNVGPTERVLNRGDICRMEIFSIIDGYHAGVCRTAICLFYRRNGKSS